jgi:hypothetical protein
MNLKLESLRQRETAMNAMKLGMVETVYLRKKKLT